MNNKLLALWNDKRTASGVWCYIDSDLSMEMAAAEGCDYVLIDLQHGVIDMAQAITMTRASQFHGTNPIIRVPHCDPEAIGKALDGGAAGVMIPMVESADTARDLVRAAHYPPQGGIRSFGPIRSMLLHKSIELDVIGQPATIAMIETVKGVEQAVAIARTPGLSAIYIGSVDLSISLGLGPKVMHDDARFKDAIGSVKRACDDAGIVAGIHCSNGEIAAKYAAQGYRMVTAATDIDLIRFGAKREIDAARATAAGR
jgi:4-hydroxy-2-oxoheptanedioate aldolase